MMFLVRSAFWLSIVYAHMPLDGGQVARVADEAQGAVVASAAAIVKTKCAQDPVSCRAIVSAGAGAVLSAGGERSSSAQIRTRSAGAVKGARPSANSLSAADLATPWRGRQTKSGA
ncbi:hypothetical protein [Methylocapsa sp. S129]|uniref:hypothetical protein n=1 Tax=Methylocapsa sp. S129 TaxID=1641869 RepID=UPI00131A9A13|nr:hypothetical protein [Methylocapsa sp. S129]